uniref:Crossover junction endonuclease MUS81 n=1 Tax=Acanthochromis polyacanthus TaxID=80966 RepID=A0A3Q1FMG3_9TELE
MSASEPVRLGRKRALPACPNPLFLRWLTELRDEAKEKGLKTQYTYQKAINSLNKYPLPLRNAKEAKILQNFGDGICKILDEKLQRYHRQSGEEQMKNDTILKKKKREYVPQRRSRGYAVLLTLYRHSQIPGSKGFMFKLELQTEAQPLCDKSFAVPDLGSKYTAWSSVSTLIQKNLLIKTHNPARYSLTEGGLALAERLAAAEQQETKVGSGGDEEEEEEGPGVVDLTVSDEGEEEEDRTHPTVGAAGQLSSDVDALCTSEKPQKSQTTSRNPSGGCLLPGTYEIILCVDFIETTGGSHHRKQELVKELQRNGVNFDVRKLNVGDFLWVAREKVAPVPGQLRLPAGRELVLDYIIERKRMDDLCGSIIDGRFREQKFRLKRCGLRRPIYLVEECGTAASHLSLPEATLQQAIINTQVIDGFFVKRVQDVRESAAYLTIMTRFLNKLYQNRTLTCRSRELEGDVSADEDRGIPSSSLISFTEFNHGALKNKCQTVREVFVRQLMQISGLSGDKAAAILEHYSTPHRYLDYMLIWTDTHLIKEYLKATIKNNKLMRMRSSSRPLIHAIKTVIWLTSGMKNKHLNSIKQGNVCP